MSSEHTIILTENGDTHACAVHHVIQKFGIQAHIINLQNALCDGHFTVNYRDHEKIFVEIGSFFGPINEIKSTWNRRLPSNYTHPSSMADDDKSFFDLRLIGKYTLRQFLHYDAAINLKL